MLKQVLAVILSGLFGFVLGFSFRIAWQESRFIVALWEDEPIVVVCPDSELTPFRVNQAIEWWGIREFKISHYHYDNDNTICSQGTFVEGIIFIRGTGEIEKEFYATTARFTLKDKMLSASILLPNRNKHMPRLLEHEIGHALGMSHVEEPGHMMHPIHEFGGEKFWIPD